MNGSNLINLFLELATQFEKIDALPKPEPSNLKGSVKHNAGNNSPLNVNHLTHSLTSPKQQFSIRRAIFIEIKFNKSSF